MKEMGIELGLELAQGKYYQPFHSMWNKCKIKDNSVLQIKRLHSMRAAS